MAALETADVSTDQHSPPTAADAAQLQNPLCKTTKESPAQQSLMDLVEVEGGNAMLQGALAAFTLFPKLPPE